MRHRATVRVAKHERRSACRRRNLQDLECVPGVRPIPVEEVLGVEEDLKALAAQERDRVFDHAQVLVERGSDRSRHLEVGRLSDDACGRRFGCDQLTDDGVRVGRR